MPQESLDATYFDTMYAHADDPWNFASSAYEAEKYAATLALLGNERYARALEIGSSIGVFTRMLAERCDELLGVDISAVALERARRRCADRSNVRFELRNVPREFPAGAFDLIVLSEVGYYWSDADLALARSRIARAGRGGTLALVHYLPKVDDYVRDGDAVHDWFLSDARFEPRHARRAERYRIDVVTIRASTAAASTAHASTSSA
jgi:SAM-dependent methyltransferase